jgi:U2 small nuclear ribonucleoprotein B''
MSSLARRGQAWVVYESLDSASAARESLHGNLAFGKKMRVSFSRNVSDITRERKGLSPRDRRTQPLLRPLIRKSDKGEVGERDQLMQTSEDFFRTDSAAPRIPSGRTYNPPNRVLLAENLPETMTSEGLTSLFGSFEGFQEVRHIPTRGVAFIEFDSEQKSQVVLTQLSSGASKLKISFKISYAKR